MARIGLNITVTGFTGKLIIRWVAASNTLAEVGRSDAFDLPYSAVYTINDLAPVVYVVELWRSDDGVALDQLIKDWNIDASMFNTVQSITYQYLTDRGSSGTDPNWADPEAGDTELLDERLAGYTKDQMYVVEAGFGPKRDDEYDLIDGGGIELLGGKQFDALAGWFITVHRTLTQTIPPSSSNNNQFSDVETITADRDFYVDTTDNLYNKLCICNKSGSQLNIVFPAFSSIPNYTRVTFNTHSGTQRYVKLQFNVGDTVKWMGQTRNYIYIRKGAEISLFFFDGACYITGTDYAAHRVGMIIWGRKTELNTIPCDGTQYNQSDYEGLMVDFIDQLPMGHVVADGTSAGQWGQSESITYIENEDSTVQESKTVYPNKGLFARTDTGTPTFRVPDHRNMAIRALKNLDGTVDTERRKQGVSLQAPGSYQVDAFKDHAHKIGGLWNESGGGQPAGGSTFNETPNYLVKQSGGSETRGENHGFIPLLCI
jgi:hypothetical protein